MRKRQKKLSRATVFGVILLTVVLCATLVYKQNTLKAKEREYAVQIKELEKQKKECIKKKKEIEEFKDYVETNEYIEEVAREKFGLVYEDEVIFEPEEEK